MLVDLGAVPAGRVVALVLAQDPEPPPGKGEEFGKASPIGLVVIVVLLIATVFLVRSMTKHLRRVPVSFDPPTVEPSAPPVSASSAPSSAEDSSREPRPTGAAPPGAAPPGAAGDGVAPRPRDASPDQ